MKLWISVNDLDQGPHQRVRRSVKCRPMDAVTAALIGGAVGSGLTALATIGAQWVAHLGGTRRERRERQYQELRDVYTRAYDVLLSFRNTVVHDLSTLRGKSRPAPDGFFYSIHEIELLGSQTVHGEMFACLTEIVSAAIVRQDNSKSTAEAQQALDKVTERMWRLRSIMRTEMGLPNDKLRVYPPPDVGPLLKDIPQDSAST